MISLNKTEADIINYLYKNRSRTGINCPYAAEIMRDLKIPKRTVYSGLETLEEKSIVNVTRKGRMKFYELTERWSKILEIAHTS